MVGQLVLMTLLEKWKAYIMHRCEISGGAASPISYSQLRVSKRNAYNNPPWIPRLRRRAEFYWAGKNEVNVNMEDWLAAYNTYICRE
jgi:hypothetical protein